MLDGHGRYVATLDWLPRKPGHLLLSRIALPISVIGGLLLIVIGYSHRRGRLMAKGLIASEARATHRAFHDTLTGLPNRRLFLDRLEHALAKLCRASETFARMSGDEFAIVQADATAGDGAALAERLCTIMQEPFELSGNRVFVGCSIGIATATECGTDPAELFRQADLALYRAKASARGHYCLFEQDMNAAIKVRRALEGDLREALVNGELQLHLPAPGRCRGADKRRRGPAALAPSDTGRHFAGLLETVAQWDWLNALGCHDAQGFLFGKAIPAAGIDRLWQSPQVPLPLLTNEPA